MKIKSYEKFNSEELILRDHLANDRTKLANERTLLAYIRTALSFFVVGTTLIKFFGTAQIYHISGWFIIIGGVLILVRGLFSFYRINTELSKVGDLDER